MKVATPRISEREQRAALPCALLKRAQCAHSGFPFDDLREEALAQTKMQQLVNSSPRMVTQRTQLSNMMGNGVLGTTKPVQRKHQLTKPAQLQALTFKQDTDFHDSLTPIFMGEIPIQGMFDALLDIQDQNPDLDTLVKGEAQEGEIIVGVRIRGSDIDGEHQEVMCITNLGRGLRMSRNNSEDTFQYGADPKYANLRILQEIEDLQVPVDEALKMFNSVHGSIIKYSHGDCHIFTKRLFNMLKNFGKKESEISDESDDDSFM